MNKETIGIIGAGPGGIICAKKIIESDMSVLLFDHKVPWDKPCGGILPSSINQVNMDDSIYPYPISKFNALEIYSTRDLKSIYKYKQPYSVISRIDLSKYMLLDLDPERIRIVNERVINIERNKNRWQIITTKNIYEVASIVGADGAGSIVRRKIIGQIPHNHLAMSYGLRLENAGPYRIAAFFSDIIGYTWLINGAAGASVGIMAQCKTIDAKILIKRLYETVSVQCPKAKIIGTFGALIPSANDPSFFNEPSCGDDWLLIGDAAGHVDPIIGEGIYYAMCSGECAAEAIIKGDLKFYDQYWKEKFGDTLIAIAKEKVNMLAMSKNFGFEMYGALQYASFVNDTR